MSTPEGRTQPRRAKTRGLGLVGTSALAIGAL